MCLFVLSFDFIIILYIDTTMPVIALNKLLEHLVMSIKFVCKSPQLRLVSWTGKMLCLTHIPHPIVKALLKLMH